MATEQKHQYPYEEIDLPSGGKLYSKDSPLHSGTIDIKYMTAKEEDILTSQNLIKKGVVLDHLLDSLILTDGIKGSNLFVGDKNAVLIAARILAYGSDYTVGLVDPDTDEDIEHTFNLSELPYRELPDDVDYSKNEFEFELPVSKSKVIFKLLTGKDEEAIVEEMDALAKLGSNITRTITTRLKHCIISVNDEVDRLKVNLFIDNMLSRDSLALRGYMSNITPDIEMVQTVDINGVEREVSVPMELSFFWPSS
jgi:hypothetical protein